MRDLKCVKFQKSLVVLVVFITLLSVTLACGSTAPEATATRRPTVTMAPTRTAYEIAFADVTHHEGERVILQGYISPRAVFSCSSHTPERCYIPFAENAESEPQILLSIAVSGAITPNTMKALPEEFHLSDIVFYDDNSQEVVDGDFIRVTGRIYLTEARDTSGFDAGTASLYVERMVLLP
jgi:hypothetical protein